jgi:DNA-binding HxlR family transcriptional regulator
MRDDEIIFEIPLDQNTSHTTLIDASSEIDNEIFSMIKLHKILANETRARLLMNVVRGLDRRFSQLMNELDANQKIINESLRLMLDEGLLNKIQKNRREVHYHPSQKGIAAFMACFALKRIMDEVE